MMWSFLSPTKGAMSLTEVVEDILLDIRNKPSDDFRLMIGTDSQPKESGRSVTFVSAIISHRVGKGARYYIHKDRENHLFSLRQRMFTEAAYSLQLGGMLSEEFQERGETRPIQVHLDIGERGATKQMIREIVSWITASGYEAMIKPDSFCASKVADRYTKS
ncbi:ribonuclease H-like YkuK family protein [Alicyclobacillus sp. SO9]|uniref:ribonuclease H-like YkuK family protein n=1 Tax=Alicyclobacillus sp. SO9 TaxID=2665646 RepID=UPI0018E731AC|nr:ribonuclease H-like YkuK family protein [Alicyclobacillus sp. SO9]QQE79393.1 ribonuclease H-like YkuK family protein [Alicyclobacillus sp. SO9]